MKYKMPDFHKKLPWRTLHIGINIATIVTGFCTFLPLSYVSMYFHWQCPLHANVRILALNESAVIVNKPNTVWGTNSICSFSTYTPVAAAIHAFIWCWFYLLMKAQLKADHQEFPMLVFSSILHGFMLIFTFVSSSILSNGFNVWCNNLTRDFRRLGHGTTCSESQDLMWPNIFDDNEKHSIYTFLRTSQVSSWLQTLTILCQTFVSGYKLYAWILATTGGYLDIRNCGRSPSRQSNTYENSNLLEDNDDDSLSCSPLRENVVGIDVHMQLNSHKIKDDTVHSE